MAKKYIGLTRTVDITFTEATKTEANKLVKFLEKNGLDELSRRETQFGLISIELNAEEMNPNWEQLRGALKESFPDYKYQFSEGVDDDDPHYYKDEEVLSIYD